MRWCKKLWFGEGAKKKAVKIIRKLKKGQFQPDIYVIVLAPGEQNQLEIYPSYILLQKYFQEQELFVIGVASGYEEAKELVVSIVDEVYQNTKDTAVKQYFVEQE